MISLKERVRDALAGVCGEVVFGHPRSFTGRELIAWRESENRCFARADAGEHLAELNYMLEIFARGAEAAAQLLEAADARMCAAGFRREAAAEQFEQDLGVSHISVRYRALADAEGNLYQ